MKFVSILLFQIGTIIFIPNLYSQITYQLESESMTGKGENTPFWLVSNRHGIATLDLTNGYLRVGIVKEPTRKNNFDYRIGLDAIETYNYTSQLIIQQAYLDLLYKKFELSIGSKEYDGVLKNQQLSSGGLTWSGNARPIPMIRLSIPQFTGFSWLMNNRLKVKLAIAYGWFTDGDYQERNAYYDPTQNKSGTVHLYNKNVLFHQKELLVKYDFADSPWAFTIGLEFNNQFCGDRYFIKGGVEMEESTPATLNHYLMTLFPVAGDKQSAVSDQQFLFGNTLGSEHLMLHYSTKEYEMKAYLENYFEDLSGMGKQNGFDGLWGAEWSRKSKQGITGVVLEYLQTTNQSGPIHWAPDDYPNSKFKDHQATGNDDYYNNGNFSGWEHWGMANGNPLLTSPMYNKNGSLKFQNTRVKAFHLGLNGKIDNRFDYRVLGTYTRGWGRHYMPYEDIKNDLSLLIECSCTPKKLLGWKFTTSLATDRGSLYEDNTAVSFKISKKGVF